MRDTGCRSRITEPHPGSCTHTQKIAMKYSIVFFLLLVCFTAQSQELYVYTEPASNMAAKSIGARATANITKDRSRNRIGYMLMPELMWGVSRKIMIHGAAFVSDATGRNGVNGGEVYAKYRVYSQDDVHDHFRVAVFGKYAFTNSPVHDQYINLNNGNTGYEGGAVATKLHKKVALSASASYLHANLNRGQATDPGGAVRNAVNYTASAGKLMLPKEYRTYGQTNLNLMVEMLGQTNLRSGQTVLDLAPSVQFIFGSRTRVDLGYRIPVVTSLYRNMQPGGLIRFEYNFFNVY